MHFVQAKGILSPKNGMNIYRGCSHGCIYCDSRSVCYQMKHDFEDVEVKINAPELLADALVRKRNKCMIGTGSMCDPYQPLEQDLGLMRRCLEIILANGFGATVITKSGLVLRDLDLLLQINERAKCVIQMTLTTFDEDLCRILEPNVSTTRERFAALQVLKDNGIPTVVWLSPLLPFINDTEENLRGVLDYCFEAGVKGIICFGIGLTLRQGDREYFYLNLDRHFPGLRQRYHRKYGFSYSVVSDESPRLMKIFHEECRKRGVMSRVGAVFEYLNDFPKKTERQLSFF